jgi:hypothetical protein
VTVRVPCSATAFQHQQNVASKRVSPTRIALTIRACVRARVLSRFFLRAAGTSLLVSLDRQLSEHVRGHWAWTLGPGGGIATGVSRSTGAWAASAELRVGAGMVRFSSEALHHAW